MKNQVVDSYSIHDMVDILVANSEDVEKKIVKMFERHTGYKAKWNDEEDCYEIIESGK